MVVASMKIGFMALSKSGVGLDHSHGNGFVNDRVISIPLSGEKEPFCFTADHAEGTVGAHGRARRTAISVVTDLILVRWLYLSRQKMRTPRHIARAPHRW